MTPTEVTNILRQFNEWRRGDETTAQPDPREIGEAIDAAIAMIDRLEAAESDALEQARLNGMGASREAALMAKLEAAKKDRANFLVEMGRLCAQCDALRAKIEAMEQQEPVGVLHVGNYYGEELQDWEFEANQCACDKLNEVYVSNPTSLPLYALPGAKGE